MVGKHPDKQLNAVELKKLAQGLHADGNGLYLDVQESGSRSWILRTTVRGRRKTIGLGGLATTGLAEAREQAADLKTRARKGEDILETRRAEKRIVPTFKDAASAYHSQVSETFDSEQHAYNWMRSLEQYVIPVFGQKTVDTIDTADVLRAIGPIWNEIPDTAKRTLRRVKVVFDYCQAKGYRTIMVGKLAVTLPNPCDGLKAALPKNSTGESHHEALPHMDVPKFIQELRKASSSLSVKLALEFLILTCSRTSEVLNARWEEFDLENKVWNVPAERMKMRKEHKVPLSDRCIAILNLAKEFNDSQYVFPSKPRIALSNMAMLMALRRMGHDDLTVHGFRATFKTWAEEKTKFDTLVIEASMAHQVKGIERHYLRTTFLDERKKLMAAWATYATATPAAKVVRMRA